MGAGTSNAHYVAKVLSEHRLAADWTDKLRYPNPLRFRKYNIIYGVHLQSRSRSILVAKMQGKKTIVHFAGSDAYWYSHERSILRRLYWRLILLNTGLVLYVSRRLEQIVGRAVFILPFRIRTNSFRDLGKIKSERDVVYYCPSGMTSETVYQLHWILRYAHEQPEEKITIQENKIHPASYTIQLPNVEVLPFGLQLNSS